jgi:Helicase conserved C-terminal domain
VSGDFAQIVQQTGLEFFDYQVTALLNASQQTGIAPRLCLFYKTGAGKTLTALAAVKRWGHDEVVVIAPPATHGQWVELGVKLRMDVYPMSHAKFRMKPTKLSRTTAVIADEVHLFGGHSGQGWKKLDTLGLYLKAPLIVASATPNYNDAERVYCIAHVMDPHAHKGGYLDFLYKHCRLEANPFSQTPDVVGFLHHADAAEWLADQWYVEYLADDLVYKIVDHDLPVECDDHIRTFGYNPRRHRMVASLMEERHTLVYQSLVGQDGSIHQRVLDLLDGIDPARPVLIFCVHSKIADALTYSLADEALRVGKVTGETPAKRKADILESFKNGLLDVLVGTATLATGTDGLDKVCDWLIILDDTDDDALRRQLIGRIMPRGLDADATKKHVHRVVLH